MQQQSLPHWAPQLTSQPLAGHGVGASHSHVGHIGEPHVATPPTANKMRDDAMWENGAFTLRGLAT